MTSDDINSENIIDLANEVMDNFFIFSDENFLTPLAPYSNTEFIFHEPFSAATSALTGVITAAELPYQLVNEYTLQRKFDRIHASESILALKKSNPKAEVVDTSPFAILERSNEKMKGFLDSEEGKIFLRDQVIMDLSRQLKSAKIQQALQELQIQTIISVWSIFESFGRSFFTQWLNKFPGDAIKVANAPGFKDLSSKQTIDIKSLNQFGFDLSDKMGDIILGTRRLDSLFALRAIARTLFNSQEVSSALTGDLWLLNQRRHLFVHKRGVVDPDYIKNSGENLAAGDRLLVSCDDVEKHIMSVRFAILEIGKASTSRLSELNVDK
ncbi:hypothetical protein [Roseinatronobacter alkalisoli]|uniref:Uncharacterized protein n=1 Tax=Roseinatronobacter alkalisoli TaxID=3028235 RepID=A0ABT5TDF9_9RHOB|nr:hypothetical protein [Roseinatronobacter sp. HJB301]MDD7973150.1 hypothetical protein [Roseinatronobacter sp. HJB301]